LGSPSASPKLIPSTIYVNRSGVCGNVGAALAAGITAALASWLGWRAAFVIPGVVCVATGVAFLAIVPDDRHRAGTRKSEADVSFSARVALMMFALYVVISICGGLTFNTVAIALPKLVDERLGGNVTLLAVGGLTTAVFLCGALAQIVMGRLVEWITPIKLFAIVVSVQFLGLFWAANATGMTLVGALALTMAAIYGQVTVGDIVIARYTADAWRGRIIARAHDVQARLVQNTKLTVHDIARAERVTAAYIYTLLRLPWLAPEITTAIVNGRQPPQLNAKRLMRLSAKLPGDWADQRTLLGFR
jgi:MFS family permease